MFRVPSSLEIKPQFKSQIIVKFFLKDRTAGLPHSKASVEVLTYQKDTTCSLDDISEPVIMTNVMLSAM